jgi:hypothetical protein
MAGEGKTTSRRGALGLMSFGAAVIAAGASALQVSSAEAGSGSRPSREDLQRILRLYGGEFGGGRRNG